MPWCPGVPVVDFTPRRAYTVTGVDAIVLVVPPVGQTVRGITLKWPDGEFLDAASLNDAVQRCTAGIFREAGRTRGVERVQSPATQPASISATASYDLFRALVPEILWEEIKVAPVVYVVPDGAMNRLPLEGLVIQPLKEGDTAATRRYWLDEGPPVVYGPSATVLVNRHAARQEQLARLAKGQGAQRLAVALGDPVFSRSGALAATWPAQGATTHKPAEKLAQVAVVRGGYLSRFGALTSQPGTRREVAAIYSALSSHRMVWSKPVLRQFTAAWR